MKRFLLLFAVAILFAGCQKFKGDVTVPAFIHLDRIEVVSSGSGESVRPEGWFTSDIDAVQLIALFPGSSKETNLGVFQLPCTVPALTTGNATYIRVVPVIRQNGLAATRIEYPFFRDTTFYDVPLAPDSTTCLGRPDADGRYTVNVCYKSPSVISQKFFEDFEPLAAGIHFTSNVVTRVIGDSACTGSGYGRIVTPDTLANAYFEITDSIVVTSPGAYLYLEMDYRTDVELRIGLRSPITQGGNDYSYDAISLYPTKKWTKIYINLGKVWSQMNHHNTFHVYFKTLNINAKGGVTHLDNVKIITL